MPCTRPRADRKKAIFIVISPLAILHGVPDGEQQMRPDPSAPALPAFATREPDLPVAPYTRAAMTVDLNADGHADIITASSARDGDSVLSVFLQSEGGGFDARVDVPVEDGPSVVALAIADLDGDAKVDVVALGAGPLSSRLIIFGGDGRGTLKSRRCVELDAGAVALAAADLAGDEATDLVVGFSEETGRVRVLENRGRLGLRKLPATPVGSAVAALVAGDLDGNGSQDLAIADLSGRVATLLQAPDGSFDLTHYDTQMAPLAGLDCGDLDHDGDRDLAVAATDGVTLLFNDATGAFPARRHHAIQARSVTVADGDDDGDLDLMFASAHERRIPVLVNSAQGTFVRRNAATLGWTLRQVLAGDFNGDGRTDFAGVSADPSVISLLYQGTDEKLQLDSSETYPVGRMPHGGTLADLDGDGRVDIVTGNGQEGTVSVLRQEEDGSFAAAREFATDTTRIDAVVALDIDRDGDPDVVGADPVKHRLVLLENTGAGELKVAETYPSDREPIALLVVDWNGDGIDDVLSANAQGPSVTVWQGDGRGGLATGTSHLVPSSPRALAAGDLDDDGDLDLVLAHPMQGEVCVLAQNAAGALERLETIPILGSPDHIALADLDLDSDLDLVVADSEERSVLVYFNNGSGTFYQEARGVTSYPQGAPGPSWLTVADLDLDGHPDIITASATAHTVSVLVGSGDGRLLTPRHFTSPGGPLLALPYDVDLDGDLDLVSFNHHAASVTVYRNGAHAPGGPVPQRGDTTGDGRVDQADATLLLDFLFLAGPPPASRASADANADGRVNLTDAVRILAHVLYGAALAPAR